MPTEEQISHLKINILTQAQFDSIEEKDPNQIYMISDAPETPTMTSELINDGDGASPFATAAQLDRKQDQLVSGESIKTINGETLLGSGDIELAGVGDKFYTHNQLAANDTWSIEHNLGKFPAVTVVDSGGSIVVGEIDYIDENNLTITFQGAFGGKAYLN